MTGIRRAIVFSFLERYALIAISLLNNILLARLLTPEEIGIYSVSLAVIGIAHVLRDFGIGSFLVQEKNLTEKHIRTAFGFALLIGSGLFVILYFAAPFAGKIYGEARMVETLRISIFNFLALPFCTVSLALLRRDMAFKRMLIVNLIGSSIGCSTSIGLAYSGFGPSSMAVGAVVGNILTGFGAWLARSSYKLLLPGFSEWRALLKFGALTTSANMVNSISADINDLVVGKVLGFGPVAMISRAQGLMNLFHRDLTGAIQNVAFPAFAKAHREGELLEPRYISTVTAVTVIAWPFYGFAALFALELLRLMFGPQWDESATIVPIYCAAGAVGATYTLIPHTLIAVGRIDLHSKFTLIFQPVRVALIVAAAVIYQSLIACAIADLLAYMLNAPFLYFFKARCVSNNYRRLWANLWLSAKVTIGTMATPTAICGYLGFFRDQPISLATFAAAILIAGVSWIISLFLFKHPLTNDPLFTRTMDTFSSVANVRILPKTKSSRSVTGE